MTPIETATKETVKQHGSKTVAYKHGGSGKTLSVPWNVGNVSDPILAVGEITKRGNWVVFGPDTSWISFGYTMEDLSKACFDPSCRMDLVKDRGVYWLEVESPDADPRKPDVVCVSAAARNKSISICLLYTSPSPRDS